MASAEAPDASASAPASPSTDVDHDGDHAAGRMLASRLTAEFVGTAFLLAAVVGSGIMAERLTDDVGLQLFQNAFATAGVLMALILTFAAASGAHFNPAVTLADWVLGGIDGATAAAYVAVQVTGGVLGVMAANVMFELDPIYWSTKDRSSANLVFAEVIATIGLLLVIHGVVRSGQPTLAAFSVGGYIAGAYYFTSSTSFANPAVTVARTFSDTFAGIRPASAPAFIVAQVVGALVAIAIIRVVYPRSAATADVSDRDTADRDTADRDTADRDTADRDAADRDAGEFDAADGAT